MKIEVNLKRSPSRKIAAQKQKQQTRTDSSPYFPVYWNLQCFAYGSLKRHIRAYEERKRSTQGIVFAIVVMDCCRVVGIVLLSALSRQLW
jgi:hypothetical protein